MRFTLNTEKVSYDIEHLDNLASLWFDGSNQDREFAKELLGENVEYDEFRKITVDIIDGTWVQVHENMILTDKGRYIVTIGYSETLLIYPDREMLFYKNGKIIKDKPSNIGVTEPRWLYTPFAPHFDNSEDEHKIINKMFKKLDISKFDLNQTFLLSAVIFGTNTVIDSQITGTVCINLKGSHKEQKLNSLKLWGMHNNLPILVYNCNGYSFLLQLSNKLTLIKILY